MKPHPATSPDMNAPELQANWSYWGLTVPTTTTCFDPTGTKPMVYETKPSRGVKPEKGMELEDTRLF